jgi:hypothetical protein
VARYHPFLESLFPNPKDLTVAVSNPQGQTAGPFMANVPPAPAGWAAYAYASDTASGTFNIRSNGDNTTVSLPSGQRHFAHGALRTPSSS